MTTTIARHPNGAGHPQTAARARAFGDAVRAKRKSLGLSQEKLADAEAVTRPDREEASGLMPETDRS